MTTPLLARARRWLEQDPDPDTRTQLAALIAQAPQDPVAAATLADCFGPRLDFGTAGIRGELGPGPAHLNRVLVRQVATGLLRVLQETRPDAAARGVVIGYDGRHKSRVFAEDSARVLAGAGLRVFLAEEVTATPLLAHAVRHMGAIAGVMVTASHNPPQDNGVKVYWEHGAQIIAPLDQQISQAIAAVTELPEPPALDALRARGLVQVLPEEQRRAYVQQVQGLRVHRVTGARAVYTAMHGVGTALLQEVLAQAGHLPVLLVKEQCDPDPDFPTVRLPNPEEKGALDLALALARAEGADLVLANDPDADRLALAIPDPSPAGAAGGGWRRLSGNELGLLLAEDLLRHRQPAPGEGQALVCTTIVSSSLLGSIAAAHGAACAEVLTGFKWLAKAAMDWPGPFVLGYEEALGYSAGGLVRDKDGVSTALLVLDLASWLKARGSSLAQALDALWRRYGLAESSQKSLVLPGADGQARIGGIMTALRADPPARIGGLEVRKVRDVKRGTVLDRASGEVQPLGLPPSDVLAYDLEGGCRVLVRPSGTEPKLKVYFEARAPVHEGEDLAHARQRAQDLLRRMEADMGPRVEG